MGAISIPPRIVAGPHCVEVHLDERRTVCITDDHDCGTACAVEMPRTRETRGVRLRLSRELHDCGTPLYIAAEGQAYRNARHGITWWTQTCWSWCVTCDAFEHRELIQCGRCWEWTFGAYIAAGQCARCATRAGAASAERVPRAAAEQEPIEHVSQVGGPRSRRFFERRAEQ